VLFLVLGHSLVRANPILVSLDGPVQALRPGDTVTVTGVLSNGGTEPIFLNGDAINLLGDGLTISDQFFSSVPISLDPGQSSAVIDLFAVTLQQPFTGLLGSYVGSYVLLGGLDGNEQTIIGSTDFTIRVAASEPLSAAEPSTLVLIALPLLVCWVLSHRRPCVHCD
jgi:hypothetical protein